MKCSYCGLVFDEREAEQACSGCPLVGHCGLLRCPRCGYEMPPDSHLISWLRGTLGKAADGTRPPEAESNGGTLLLADVKPGQRVCVVDADETTREELLKLMAMGLLPGAKLQLLRRTPSIVYQSGFSQFAVDAELASQVIVELLGSEGRQDGR